MKTAEQKDSGTSAAKAKGIIIREAIMIPCQYCGGLLDQTGPPFSVRIVEPEEKLSRMIDRGNH